MNKAGDLPLTAQTLACHFIGNQWVRPAEGRTVPVIDPATRDLGGDRALMRLAQLATVEAERLARIESRDVGKPLAQSQRDIAATARHFEFYAGACDKIAGEVLPYPSGYTVMAMRVPFGVTGHIGPWNYPSQIFGRSVGAALAAGNACVLKPPEDASLAAAAAHHCPVTLELGGKSPQIVFADADLEAAVPSRSQTARPTGSSRACGRATAGGRCASRRACGRDRCS